ncbi:hypothetical protein ACK83U_02470 [Rhizobium sp. WW22]|uniref:hypothetical protein n=1 Tax=Rhizobium sp. WW22 TaxID=3389070 RepID=UPI003999F3B0
MRLSRTTLSNASQGVQPEGDLDPEQAAEEARRAEQIAARRAFLEEKIRNAREAKRKAEEQRHAEEKRLAEEVRKRTAAAPPPVVEALQAAAVTSEQEMPILPQGISAEDLASPGWQNAFLMGPNVRFTRTRENEIISRRPPVEPKAEIRRRLPRTPRCGSWSRPPSRPRSPPSFSSRCNHQSSICQRSKTCRWWWKAIFRQ